MGQQTVRSGSGSGHVPGAAHTPADSARPDVTRRWFGGNYLGAAPPASARIELSRGGWGSKSRADEIANERPALRRCAADIGPDARSAEVDARQDR